MIDFNFIFLSFRKIALFKGKQLRFLVPVFKRDLVSSRLAFIREIYTSEILN